MTQKSDEPTLLDRLAEFPLPPQQLDFLRATPEELRHYGLPPRPSPLAEPVLFDIWRSFFVPRPQFVLARVELVGDIFRIELRQTPATAAIPRFQTSRYETSRNWCGAYIEPSADKVFVQVSGRWTVPRPAPPLDAQPDAYVCSTWVGLDGQRRYLDSSLPQIGTWQSATLADTGKTTIETYAWCQWWARDDPQTAPGRINGVPVKIGDHVACMVRVWEPSVAAVYVKNLSTNLLAHFRIRAPVLNGHRFTISGATAEWITERPTRPKRTSLLALADYTAVDMTQCHAAEAYPPRAQQPAAVESHQALEGAKFIRMYAAAANRTSFISMPSRAGDTAVTMTYGGFPS